MHVYMPPRFLLYIIYIYTMQIIFSWIYILTFKHASASSAKYPQTFYVYGKYGFIQGMYLNSMHIIFICQYYAYHSHSYKVPIMTKVHFRTVLIIMAFTLVKKRLLCLYKDIFILQLWSCFFIWKYNAREIVMPTSIERLRFSEHSDQFILWLS